MTLFLHYGSDNGSAKRFLLQAGRHAAFFVAVLVL